VKLAKRLLDEVLREGERAYPEEACGYLTGTKDAIERVVPMTNAAEKRRAEEPKEYSRGARDGYVMDPNEQLRVEQAERKAGRDVIGVYHSHPDVGAYFSEEDRRRALPWGAPLYPIWLVADVRAGKALGAKSFRWSEEQHDFVEEPVETE
jgi:proteasome lid subunit RPN8/RPN11